MLVESELRAYEVPLIQVFSDADFNCRGKIAPIDVIDLARSIDSNGLQQSIVLQPYTSEDPNIKYRIVSGHRRFAAFRVLGRKTIPAVIKDGLTEVHARKLNLEENLKRKDLNMLQEALAIKHLKRFGFNQDDVAKDLGMSRGWVQVRFIILDLPPEIQEEVAAGFLTQENIKELNCMSRDRQFEAVKRIKTARLNGSKRMISVGVKKKKNPLQKCHRKREEIFEMQSIVYGVVGANFGTRAMAWCAGEISTLEFLRDLKDVAQEKGIRYEIPTEIMSAVRL